MITGANELVLNEASLKRIIQKWMDSSTGFNSNIISIKPKDGSFIIKISSKEEIEK